MYSTLFAFFIIKRLFDGRLNKITQLDNKQKAYISGWLETRLPPNGVRESKERNP